MFVCTTCVKKFEGPTIDFKTSIGKFGMSYGKCEFCGETDGCYDLWSGDSGWYPKKEKPVV